MLPPPLRAIVDPKAVMSFWLKLIVAVAGCEIGAGPRYTDDAALELTIVTLAVTAVAPLGMPPRVATRNVRGVAATSLPDRPFANRVSSRRTGASGWNVLPTTWSVAIPVAAPSTPWTAWSSATAAVHACAGQAVPKSMVKVVELVTSPRFLLKASAPFAVLAWVPPVGIV